MVATTLPAVVRVVDLPIGTTVTGGELFEAVQTSGGIGQSVQLSLSQMVSTGLGALPTGGSVGQLLSKTGATNYAAGWSSIVSFFAVGTSLATTGSATSVIVFVANQGITSTQIANNSIGTAQLATNIGITGTLTVTGSFGAASGITATGILSQFGTTLINGTTLVTAGNFGVVGTALFTSGTFGVVGTTLVTGTFGQVGTSLMTGAFGVVGTTSFTGVYNVNGTSLFTSGNFGVVGTTQFTSGAFNVNGTTLFTSGTFGVVGTTLHTGIVGIVGSTVITGTLNVSGTANLTGVVLLPATGSGILKASSTGVVSTAVTNTDYITTSGTANMSTGFVLTVFNAGNATTGTITLSPLNGNYQYLSNNGAFTFAAYSTFEFAMDVLLQNGTAPGNVTFSGWRVGANVGDTISSTARLIQSAVIVTGSPGVVTSTSHAANVNDTVWFSTSGSLPTGMTSGTIYYVSSTTANTFQIATSPGTTTGINLSGAQSGTHTSTFQNQYLVSFRSMHFVPTYTIKALQ